jgi:hypothetical protein
VPRLLVPGIMSDSTRLDEKPQLFCCSYCKTPIGTYTGRLLQIGTALFRKGVDILCVRCGSRSRWSPSEPSSQ